MIKRATAPKIGMQITIRTHIAFAVEGKFIFFILNREIIDKTIQDKSRSILNIENRKEIPKLFIIFSFKLAEHYLETSMLFNITKSYILVKGCSGIEASL
jgi:hypothetical protein